MEEPKFTPEQIGNRAKENTIAFLLTAVAYFKEHEKKHGLSPEGFMAFVGNKLAPGWKSLKRHDPTVVMDLLALNFASMGGSLVAMAGNDTFAQATFTNLPPSQDLEFFDLTREDVDVIWHIFQPIAAYLGLKYEWRREQDQVTISLAR